MSITNAERERLLRERVAPSYQRHLVGLQSEVEILEALEAERDPDYDVAAALAQVDEETGRRNLRCAERARERKARARERKKAG